MKIHGSCDTVITKDGSLGLVIILEKQRNEKPASLVELVATLLHELTHAFLRMFVCLCPRCLRNDFNGVGVQITGHGPIFRGMHYAAMVTLASWSEDFGRFFKTHSNGTYIQEPSLASEKMGIEDAKRSDALQQMYMVPYIKNPSSRLLIQISEDYVAIDVNRLRANVKRTASSIRLVTGTAKLTDARKKLNEDVFPVTDLETIIDSSEDWTDTDSDLSMQSSDEESAAD
ncbi:hypothetical protein E0Z10_g4400 [Xylaria hypoxylon]|uniref:SprT-like domain-containing protein n=1 Tax=Xylaria hypoxylon TaxID=37992 RepID=A0A4Z0YY19_9PEZI|nr:hypothetical protein E0Z10_g4400 [Xylaria hypoxylon]